MRNVEMPRNAGYALYINYKMLVKCFYRNMNILYKMPNEIEERGNSGRLLNEV